MKTVRLDKVYCPKCKRTTNHTKTVEAAVCQSCGRKGERHGNRPKCVE